MRIILRSALRAIGARLGWVLVGLVLLALGIDARADPSCPTGLVSKWTVVSAIPQAGCTTGQHFPSVEASNSACLPAHGAAVPPEYTTAYHFSGNVYAAYDGFSTGYQLRSRSHDGGHENQHLITITQVNHSCAEPPPPPTCNLAPGSQHGLTYVTNSNPTNKYCVSNCEMQMQTVMQSPDGNLYGLVVNADAGTGKECAGAEVPNVESPGQCVGTPAQCQSSEFSGPVDDVDPEPSGASWGALDTSGCVTTESGAIYCLANYSGAARPDNGVPGIAATPDAVVEYQAPAAAPGDTSTTVNYYQSSTVNASTNYGTGGDPSVAGNCGAPGQPACKNTGACGGTGQPACSVDINEEGTPDGTGVDGPAFDQDTAYDGILAQAQTNPASGKTLGGIIPSLDGTPCTSITLDVPGATNWVIPGASGCAFLDRLKALLAFALFIGTAFVCYQRVMESI